MPGIVGLVTKKPREWAEQQLLRMVEAIRHEPQLLVGFRGAPVIALVE